MRFIFFFLIVIIKEKMDEIDDDMLGAFSDDTRTTPYPSALIRNYALGIIPSHMIRGTKRKPADAPPAKRVAPPESRLFQFIPVFPGTVIEITRSDDAADDIESSDGAHPFSGDILSVMPKAVPPIVFSTEALHTRDIVFLSIDTMVDQQQNATTAAATIRCKDVMTWSEFDIIQYTKFTTISSSSSAMSLRMGSGCVSPVDQICQHIDAMRTYITRSAVLCIMFADTGHSMLARKILAGCYYLHKHAREDDAGLFDYSIEAGIRSIRLHVAESSGAVDQEVLGGSAPDRHSHDLGEAIYNGLTQHTSNPLHDASTKLSSEIQKIVSALAALCARGRSTLVLFSTHPVPVMNSPDMIYLSRDCLI